MYTISMVIDPLTCATIIFPQENGKLRQDLVTLEKAVTERMGYLERFKVTLCASIAVAVMLL